jgi:hypothetical protein
VVVVLAYILIRAVLDAGGPGFSEMTADNVLLTGVVMLGFFAVHFLISVPFASYQAYKFAREQWPDEWAIQSGVSKSFKTAHLVFGWGKLNKAGNSHARLLSAARIIVQVSVIDLLIGLAMIGWALAQ